MSIRVHYPFHPLAGADLEVVRTSRHAHMPITVRGPDGIDLKIPRWMTEPATSEVALAAVATLAVEALRAVSALLTAQARVKPSPVENHPRSQAPTPAEEDDRDKATVRVAPPRRWQEGGRGRKSVV